MFEIKLMNGYVDLHTLSENEQYFYRITKPNEVSMSIYTAYLAFYDRNDNLIYRTVRKPASFLPPFETFLNVYWLKKGDFALFLEYDRDNSCLCVLSLNDKECFEYKLGIGEKIDEIVELIKSSQSELSSDFLIKNKFVLKKSGKGYIFSRGFLKRWYPRR